MLLLLLLGRVKLIKMIKNENGHHRSYKYILNKKYVDQNSMAVKNKLSFSKNGILPEKG